MKARTARPWLGALVGAVLLATTLPARAEVRDELAASCDRLHAEATAQASVLYAPRLQIEAARAPRLVDVRELGAAVGGPQARAAIAYSATDALRGRALEGVAHAECALARARLPLEHLLAVGTRLGELEARRAELAVLDAREPEIAVLLAELDARFAHQRATAADVHELRERARELRTRAAELRHDVALLAPVLEVLPTGLSDPAALAAQVARVGATTLAVDRARARVLALSAWRLDVRGGVAAGEQADWFAVAEFGYALGRPWQAHAQRRGLDARARELAEDARALAPRVAQLQRALRDSLAALVPEQRALAADVHQLASERARLAAMTEPGDAARHLAAQLTIEAIWLGARQASLDALVATRRPLARETP